VGRDGVLDAAANGRVEAECDRLAERERSASLVSAERDDLQNEFIEITVDEANQLVERIRISVTGANNDGD